MNSFRLEKNIPELDGLLGTAIIMVIVFHYFSCLIVSNDPFSFVFRGLTKLAWSGVDLFFVLSGFLLGSILMENVGSKNYFKTFYIRRAFRIIPIYFVILLLFIIAFNSKLTFNEWLINDKIPLYSYFIFIQNYLMIFHQLWI